MKCWRWYHCLAICQIVPEVTAYDEYCPWFLICPLSTEWAVDLIEYTEIMIEEPYLQCATFPPSQLQHVTGSSCHSFLRAQPKGHVCTSDIN